ncbi:MAG: hypothetical protein V7727_20145, partial [Sneathiella sp.]
MVDENIVTDADKTAVIATEKLLGDPVFLSFSDEILKIRRNMLILTLIAYAVALSGATVDQSISFYGLKLTNLTTFKLQIGITILISYHIVHFTWLGLDSLKEWDIRRTGTNNLKVTNQFEGNTRDLPRNPRQSSLYGWWLEQDKSLPQIEKSFEELKSQLEEFYKNGTDVLSKKPIGRRNDDIWKEISLQAKTMGTINSNFSNIIA